MAEYDGSIRIGVKLDLDNAEKQLEHLKSRMQGQIKEINQQAQAVNKLKAEYDKLLSGMAEPKAIKAIADDIAKTKAEAILLEEELFRLSSMDAVDVSPETVQRMQELKDQIAAADERSDLLKQNLLDLSVSPEMIDKISEMADRVQSANSALEQMNATAEQTNVEIGSTEQQIDKFNEYLRSLKENATVADQGILDLQEELKTLEKRDQDLEAAGVTIGFKERDDTKARIREIKDALNEYSSSLGQADTKSESWMSRLGKSAKRMGAATVSAAKKAGSAVGGLMKRIANLGRNKGFEKAGRSASSFSRRLKEIVKGALFFNIISRALTGLTNQLGKYLSANKDFSAALDGIKSNLLTAFQPIYDAAMPALTKLMEVLESASAKMASFVAMIFGTTASQAQQNAKDLYEQANAEEAVGEAAEDAEKKQKKFLASFDTIEKLGEEESKTSQDKKTDEKDKLGFDTAFEEVKVPQWLTDFWKVFQDSWKQYGEATVQAFRFAMDGLKAAAVSLGQVFMSVWTDGTGLAFLNQIQLLLQQILLMIGNIGQTFAQVWSSGVGVSVLTNLFGLLQTILGIIQDISASFSSAWNAGAGVAAISAILFNLNATIVLLKSVGDAFRAAWNDNGMGAQILENIMGIIEKIQLIAGNLKERFREAWEANGNGQAIWTAILGIIEKVAGTIETMAQKTAEWASELNFEPLISGARELLEKLNPVIEIIGEAIASIWENTVLPFFSYLIEDGIPALLEGLSGIFDYLASHPETLKALTELVLQFIAAFALAPVIASVAALAKAFDPVTFAITSAISAIILLVANFQKMNSLERVVGVIGAVTAALGALAVVIFSIQGGAFGIAMGVAALVAGLAMVAAAVGGAAKRSYSGSGRSSFSAASYSSAMPSYNLAKLPHLADGAVISPNNEFLAVLGDQRAGTNIEAPLSTIEQAVDNVLTRRGLMGGGSTKVDVTFTGSLAQLARVLQPEINVETQRLGPDLVGV